MTPLDDSRDRLIRLETEVQHLQVKVDDYGQKVNAMHSLLLQAKGARWAIITAAAIGGFISAKLAPFFPWLK